MGRLALHLAGGEVRRNHVVDRGHRDLPLVQTVRTSLTHTRHRSKSKVYAVPCTTGRVATVRQKSSPRAGGAATFHDTGAERR